MSSGKGGAGPGMDGAHNATARERPLSLRLDARRWLVVAAFGVLVAVGCRDMHFNADTLHYVDVARTWIHDHTLATWHLNLASERVPATDILWPPMYSILLAGPLAIGLSPEAATWIVSVLSHVALLWMLMAVSRRIEWGLLLSLLLVYLTFSQGIAFRAFSETPFMVFTFGALMSMALALQHGGEGRSRVLWLALFAGVLTAAAALTRHIGMVLIPTLGLVALLAPAGEQAHRLKRRMMAIIGLAIGAGLPLGLWFMRHWLIGGRYFGPERPESRRTALELVIYGVRNIYSDAMILIVVILVGVIGYHLLQREAGLRWQRFTVALAVGAVIFAIFHETGTLASHGMYRLDNPPEGRQLFPGYAALLLIGAALISLAGPPERLLRRRWPLIAVFALPLVLAPLVAGPAALDLTPPRTTVDDWVAANTGPDDIIIGWRAWSVRYFTGRPVLQSGMITEPSVYRGPRVAEFLERFGSHFTAAWLLVPLRREDPDEVIRSYRQAGLALEEMTDLDVYGVRHYREVRTVRVYGVTGWR